MRYYPDVDARTKDSLLPDGSLETPMLGLLTDSAWTIVCTTRSMWLCEKSPWSSTTYLRVSVWQGNWSRSDYHQSIERSISKTEGKTERQETAYLAYSEDAWRETRETMNVYTCACSHERRRGVSDYHDGSTRTTAWSFLKYRKNLSVPFWRYLHCWSSFPFQLG